MGDVEKDVERALRLRLSGSDKLRVASSITDFVVDVFRERIKREHPKAGPKRLLEILRGELSYGRRDV
jgi:hypothetical protein